MDIFLVQASLDVVVERISGFDIIRPVDQYIARTSDSDSAINVREPFLGKAELTRRTDIRILINQ